MIDSLIVFENITVNCNLFRIRANKYEFLASFDNFILRAWDQYRHEKLTFNIFYLIFIIVFRSHKDGFLFIFLINLGSDPILLSWQRFKNYLVIWIQFHVGFNYLLMINLRNLRINKYLIVIFRLYILKFYWIIEYFHMSMIVVSIWIWILFQSLRTL